MRAQSTRSLPRGAAGNSTGKSTSRNPSRGLSIWMSLEQSQGHEKVSDGLEMNLRKRLCNSFAHLLARCRIKEVQRECLLAGLRARPLSVAVPKAIGAAVQPRPKRTLRAEQGPGHARPCVDELALSALVQAPAVQDDEGVARRTHLMPGSGAGEGNRTQITRFC